MMIESFDSSKIDFIRIGTTVATNALLKRIGTSTDLSRNDGEFEHVFKSTKAGVTIQAPQLDSDTVAARSGLCNFSGWVCLSSARVLPESAGAHPGITCFSKGIP
ncbi:unnamed protein product [Clavelina lepadiformis]|uniref:Hydantoinase A/oxoprolinase domain-containing protein n=1 Tax=Clavelina lepadiformis TaxID=159417 RepID=A0ABP0G7B5_CLALP